MASQTIATRMELLKLKKKVALALKGHKLLKEKRDALISEFFKLLDSVKSVRKEMEEKLRVAYKSLILVQAISGYGDVKRAASASKDFPGIESSEDSIMGVKVPKFSLKKNDNNGKDQGYSLLSTSLEMDTVAKNFKEALELVIKLAEVESTTKMLAEEIKKTKRKVNALEQVLIPRLNDNIVYIKMHLEEMERESFSRLKVIKKSIS